MSENRASIALPRRAARLFFRHNIENGVAVALCMAAAGLAIGAALGLDAAVLAATGAMCVSIVDQPGPLGHKARVFAAAIAASSAISFLAGFAEGHAVSLALLVAAMSAGFALVTVYGRPALTLGIAGVLSLVLGMAIPAGNTQTVLLHGVLFMAGACLYALLALGAALLLDDRDRRMFLNETLLAFAAYLRARAGLYDLAVTSPAALREVIEAHGVLMERLQAARDMIFTGKRSPARRKWIAGMLAFLDAYEAVLSSDADWETLRQTATEAALRSIAALIRGLAQEADGLALALVAPMAPRPASDYDAGLAALDAEIGGLTAQGKGETAAGLQAMREKIAETIERFRNLAETLARGRDAAALPEIDLSAFVQVQDTRLSVLRAHLNLRSPVMRYAIRFTLAMLAGYALTVALPNYVHGGWILLTVALIMRASYAITRRRRNDRILGTLAGCAVAAAAIPLLPPLALLALMIAAVGAAHAYAVVNYRVTSFAASLMALLLLHFLEPQTMLLGDRVIDTLIGAGLSILFGYLLPSWEWRDVPRLTARLVETGRGFAAAALSPDPVDQDYRLARKCALDSFTTFAVTARRLSSEPGARPRQLANLNALLGATYLLLSDLASVQSLLRLRGKDMAPQEVRDLLGAARAQVLDSLSAAAAAPPRELLRRRGWTEMPAADATAFLTRRLTHIEHAARRVAALAALAPRPAEPGPESDPESDRAKLAPK